MSNKTHGPVRTLVERMYDVTRSYMLASGVEAEELLGEWQQVCDDADALDAEIDPKLLTAAWLHGADHARRKARWPEPTDAVVEQLARAWHEEWNRTGDWPLRSEESRNVWRKLAAAVLRRLREQEGEDAAE